MPTASRGARRPSTADAPLLLAGHTHCGQIVLPFYGPPVDVAARRYRCGLVREGGRLVETDWDTAMGRIVERSRALHALAPGSRLVTVPGGHHRTVQHDPELEAFSVRWLRRALVTP